MVGGVPGIEYDLATSWGASGAPVLDAEGRVIAIHRAWFEDSRREGVVGIPVDHLRSLRWIRGDLLLLD
jgi:S1-C subfamily serine protease